MPMQTTISGTDDEVVAYLKSAAESRLAPGPFSPRDVVTVDRSKSALPEGIADRGIGIVLGCLPNATAARVLCMHANGNEVEVSIPVAALATREPSAE
jgi:hypothetical protein